MKPWGKAEWLHNPTKHELQVYWTASTQITCLLVVQTKIQTVRGNQAICYRWFDRLLDLLRSFWTKNNCKLLVILYGEQTNQRAWETIFFNSQLHKQKKLYSIHTVQINFRDKPFLVVFFGCFFEPAFLTEDKVTFWGIKMCFISLLIRDKFNTKGYSFTWTLDSNNFNFAIHQAKSLDIMCLTLASISFL